ncbi:hypothetical protein J6590_076436 [Homalodisca vitripennis]|nr:hypothetical protein J6590_076436 [Homalodisca vitripennis]
MASQRVHGAYIYLKLISPSDSDDPGGRRIAGKVIAGIYSEGNSFVRNFADYAGPSIPRRSVGARRLATLEVTSINGDRPGIGYQTDINGGVWVSERRVGGYRHAFTRLARERREISIDKIPMLVSLIAKANT